MKQMLRSVSCPKHYSKWIKWTDIRRCNYVNGKWNLDCTIQIILEVLRMPYFTDIETESRNETSNSKSKGKSSSSRKWIINSFKFLKPMKQWTNIFVIMSISGPIKWIFITYSANITILSKWNTWSRKN